MAAASWAQSSFLSGEFSDTAQGRFDDPAYRAALNVCLNALPIEAGAWTRRPGTMHAKATRGGAKGRVFTFTFKQASAVSIEATNGHFRFREGASLVDTNDSVSVVAISAANPAVVQTGGTTWSTGDQVFFTGLGATATPLQNRLFAITVSNSTHFSIADALTGAAINGATLGALAATATVHRVLDLASPFTSGSWATMRPVQAETTMYLLDGTGAAQPQLLVATPPTANAPASFAAVAAQNFQDGPYLDANPGDYRNSRLTIQSDGSFLLTTGQLPDPRIANGTGLTAGDVGRAVRLFSEPPPWPGPGLPVAGVIYTLYGQTSDVATYWECLVSSATSRPDTDITSWAPIAAQNAVVWAWGKITSVLGPGQFTATLTQPLLHSSTGTVIFTWRLGVYSNAVGWPTCGVYHEGRLWLAGSIDNRVDCSTVTDTNTFSPTDQFGNVLDSSGMSYTFLADDVNPFFWMASDDRGIICGTQAGEWLISATTQNLALTPTNIQAHRVTRYGCANIEPRRAGVPLILVKRYARKLLEYFPDVFSGRLTAPNLSEKSQHLTQTFLQEIAYTQELSPNIWARRGDGALVGWAYKRDNMFSSQGPAFIGGHRHELGSGRVVESLCAGPSVGGNLDTITMVTNDPATNVRHVEVMTDIFDEGQDITTAWFLDDAVAPTSYTWDLNAKTLTLNGLWHLNGKNVAAFVAGLDAGNYTPANGSITVMIDGTANALLTMDYVQPFLADLPAVVGFPYNSDGQLLRLADQKQSGVVTGSALGKMQRANEIAVLVTDTAGGNTQRGLMFGSDFGTSLKPALFQPFRNAAILAENVLFTGVYRRPITAPFSYDNDRLTWRCPRMLPATICAIGVFQDAES